jgi:hypothetical protein
VNIGDLFLRVLAEFKDFDTDVEKHAASAGDKAGATLGSRMGSAVKDNFGKVIAAGGALVGGIMLKGIQELNSFAADFRVQTGATADEADRAKVAILHMSGDNIQPLKEIGDALIAVHTNLHLSGAEAETVTDRFLKFAHVTGNDAAAEVTAFQKILDAWNLTAADAAPIMDVLIASHQRYGTVILDNESALAALAPVMLAANIGWEEANGLLNAAHAAGIDNVTAITAMTKAFAKVKSPIELKALVADIAATTDNTERATKAIDLFGPKAGPKMAQLLAPGSQALQDYTINAGDVADTTTKAAGVLDDELGTKLQLLLKKAGAALIGFGNDWGNMATVLATGLTVAGGLGGKKIGPLLAQGWTSAANSGVVRKAVVFAGGKVATIYLATLIAGDKIGEALSGAWAKTGAKVLAAAGVSGAAAGTAFAIASAAAIVAAPVAVIYVALQIGKDVAAAKKSLSDQVDDVIKAGTLDGMLSAKKALQDQIGSEKLLGIIPFQFAGEVDSMNSDIARIDAAIATLPPGMKTTTDAATTLSTKGSRALEDVGKKAGWLATTVQQKSIDAATYITTLTNTIVAQATAAINGYYDPMIEQSQLLAARDAVDQATIARNHTKAGTDERRAADLTLLEASKAYDQLRLNMLASGTLTAKDTKTWLAQLQAKYKTSTGDAKAKIGELITEIRRLQSVSANPVVVRVEGGPGARGKAAGGPVTAGTAYWVNEDTPNSEMWVPSVSGTVYPASSAVPVNPDGAGGTNVYNVQVAGLMQARTPDEIGSALRRLSDFGVLPPRPAG